MIDGLAKMRTPKSECAPVLNALMSHLATGLSAEPSNLPLRDNIRSCPASQLIKLMTALKVRCRLCSASCDYVLAETSGCSPQKLRTFGTNVCICRIKVSQNYLISF